MRWKQGHLLRSSLGHGGNRVAPGWGEFFPTGPLASQRELPRERLLFCRGHWA